MSVGKQFDDPKLQAAYDDLTKESPETVEGEAPVGPQPEIFELPSDDAEFKELMSRAEEGFGKQDTDEYYKAVNPEVGEYGIGDTELDSRGGISLYQLSSLEDVRAQRQTGFELAAKATANFGIEAVAGVMTFAGTLLDIPQMGNIIMGEEEEFDNWFNAAVREGKESMLGENGAAMKIYQTKAAEQGFAPTDATWWAKGAGTLGTSVGLMLPALALTYVSAGALGGIGAAVSGATVSRYVENTMEAFDVSDTIYKQLKKDGVGEEEARERAGEQGRNTWYTNLAMLPVDIIQFAMAGGAMKAATASAGKALATDMAAQIPQEAFEEFFQGVTADEAIGAGLAKHGFYDEGFNYRLGDYVRDEKLWNAAFWGAMGGGIFSAANPLIEKRMKKTAMYNSLLKRFAAKGDAVSYEKAAAMPAYGTALTDFDSTGGMKKSVATMEKMAQDPNLDEAAKTRITAIATDLKELDSEIPNLEEKGHSKEEIRNILELSLDKRSTNRAITGLQEEISALEMGMQSSDALSPAALAYKGAQVEHALLNQFTQQLTRELKKEQKNHTKAVESKQEQSIVDTLAQRIKRLETTIGKVDKAIPKAVEKVKESLESFKTSDEFNEDVDVDEQILSTAEGKYITTKSHLMQDKYYLEGLNHSIKGAYSKRTKPEVEKKAAADTKASDDFVMAEEETQKTKTKIAEAYSPGDEITFIEDGKEIKAIYKGLADGQVDVVEIDTGIRRPIALELVADSVESKLETKKTKGEAINDETREGTNKPKDLAVQDTKAQQVEKEEGNGFGLTAGEGEVVSPNLSEDASRAEEANEGPSAPQPTTAPAAPVIENRTEATNAVAWVSATTGREDAQSADAKATTDYFEADRKLAGVKAEVVIDMEGTADTAGIKLVVLDAAGNPITIDGGQVRGFLHLPKYYLTESEQQQMRATRQAMLDAIAKGEKVIVEFQEKTGGHLLNSETPNSLEEVFQKSIEDINIVVVGLDGTLFPTKPIQYTSMLAEEHRGRIAVVVRDYGGKEQVKIGYSNKYTPALSEAAFRVLSDLARYSPNSAATTKLSKFFTDNEASEVRDIQNIFNFDPAKGEVVTLNELRDFLVVEGKMTEGKPHYLHVKKRALHYTRDGQTVALTAKSTPADINAFKAHLQAQGFPVRAMYLGNPNAKKFYHNHGMLNFKLGVSPTGNPIHSPMITFKKDFETIAPVDKKSIKASEVEVKKGTKLTNEEEIAKKLYGDGYAEFAATTTIYGESTPEFLGKFLPIEGKSQTLKATLQKLDHVVMDDYTANVINQFLNSKFVKLHGSLPVSYRPLGEKIMGTFDNGRVVLNSDVFPTLAPVESLRTVVHEIIHSGTATILDVALKNPSALSAAELEYAEVFLSMYDDLNLTATEKEIHAYSDVHEMVANFFSSEKYRTGIINRLAENRSDKGKSVWRRLVAYFKNLFGIGISNALRTDIRIKAEDALTGILGQSSAMNRFGFFAEEIAGPGLASEHELNADETDELVEFMMTQFFKQSGGQNITSDNLAIDFTAIKEEIKAYGELGVAPEVMTKALREDNFKVLQGRLMDNLRQMGIVIDEENGNALKEIGDYDKPAFTINRKKNANLGIKLMMASLPKVIGRNAEGKLVTEKGKVLKLPKLAPLNASWYAAQNILKDFIVTPEDSDVYQVMRNKLGEFAPFYPTFNKLTEWLDAAPEYKRTQFMKSFHLMEIDYAVYLIDGQKENIRIRRTDATSLSKRNNLLEIWKNGFLKSFFTEGKGVYKPKASAEKAISKFNTLYKKLNTNVRNGNLGKTTVQEWTNFLGAAGIPIDSRTLEYGAILKNKENPALGLQMFLKDTVYHVFRSGHKGDNSLENLIKRENAIKEGDVLNPITGDESESKLKNLVEIEMLFREQMNESTVLGAESDSYWLYQTFDHANIFVEELNSSPSKLQELLALPFYVHSPLLKYIKKTGAQIAMDTWNNARRTDASDDGSKYSSMERPDDLLLKLWGYGNNVIPYVNQADKSRHYELTIGTVEGQKAFSNYMPSLKYNENIGLYDDTLAGSRRTITMIGSLFVNELNTARLAWEQVFGAKALPDDQLIEDLHYTRDKNGEIVKTLNGLPTGSVFHSSIIPELRPGTQQAKDLKLYTKAGKPRVANAQKYFERMEDESTRLVPEFFEGIGPIIINRVRKQADKLIQMAVDDGLIERNETGGLINKNIPKSLLNKTAEGNVTPSGQIYNLIGKAAASSIYMNAEIISLFYGDTRVFSSMIKDKEGNLTGDFKSSFMKRITGGTAVKGRLRVDGTRVRPYYNVAVISDLFHYSEKLLSDGHIKNVAKATGLSEGEVKEIMTYKNVNVADAQSWMTISRAREIFEGEGEWLPEHEAAYGRLSAGNLNKKDIALFSKAVNLQPQKGQYFATHTIDNQRVSVYDKYAEAILYPGLTKGTQLDTLRLAMESKDIDEVITRSGTKGAVQGPATIFDKDGKLVGDANTIASMFTVMTRENKSWGRQVDMKPKSLNSETSVSTQMRKNVFTNIVESREYATGRTGAAILSEKNAVIGELSRRGQARIHKTLGYDPVKKRFDEDHVRAILRDESVSSNAPQDLIDALDAGVNINALPQDMKPLWYRIASNITKATVKLKQLGGGFVQMSVAGISDTTAVENIDTSYLKDPTLLKGLQDNVLWLKDRKELDPPILKDGKLIPGQILLPYKFLKMVNGDISKINADLLKMVGYRIPNQGNSSTDLLEVVGILPEAMGDTVVAYAEITEKTGSDFDIDKMYIMAPNFYMTENGLEKVPYNVEESEAGLKDRYDTYIRLIGAKQKAYDALQKAGYWNARSASILKQTIDTLNMGGDNNAVALLEAAFNEDIETSEVIQGILLAKDETVLYMDEFSKLPINEQLSEEALQNRFLEIITEVLSEPAHYLDMMTPLEYTTDLVKKDLNAVLNQAQDTRDFYMYGLADQIDAKYSFAGGKAQLGLVMNTLQDHSIRREVKRYIKLPIRNLTDESTDLHAMVDDNGVLISQVYSAYGSLHVDIANDPIIIRANWSSETTPVGLMLIAAGVPFQWANRFINQPIISEYIKKSRASKAKMISPTSEKGSNLSPEEMASKKYNGGKYISKNNLEITNPVFLGEEQLFEELANPTNEAQIGILGLYKHYEAAAKVFNNSIDVAKIDGTPPKHLIDAYVKDFNRKMITGENVIGNWKSTFSHTFLGDMWAGSVDIMIEGLTDIAIHSTPAFQTAFRKAILENASSFIGTRDANAAEQFMDELYGTLGSNSELSMTKDEYTRAFLGTDSLAHRTVKYQDVNHELHNNKFIRYINSSIKAGANLPSVVYIDNTLEISTDVIQELRREWSRLYNSENPEYREYARELVQATYYSSNLRFSTRSLVKILPNDVLKDMGWQEHISDAMVGDLQDPNYLVPMIDQVYKHLSENNKLVPPIKKADAQAIPGVTNIAKAHMFIVDIENNKKLKVGKDDHGKDFLKPYVSTQLTMPINAQGDTRKITGLYRFIGLTQYKGRLKGVYKRVNTLGYHKKGIRSTEYNFNETGKTSVYPQNNVTLSDKQVNAMATFLAQSVTYSSRVVETLDIYKEQGVSITSEQEAGERLSKLCSPG